MPEERLQKFLARAGVASRRRAERMIAAGRVRVNGAVVREMGVKVDPQRDRVEVDGRVIPAAPPPLRVAMLHKPRGVISSARDPQRRRTVTQLVPSEERLYPVGRLDYDSEGLILLTNDGDLAFALTHPRHQVPKTYHVWVAGAVGEEALRRLASGLELDGRRTAPAVVRRRPDLDRPGETALEIELREGRKRQIRRMCEAVGHRVRRLVRVAVGPLRLGDLPPGRFRWLSEAEIAVLRAAAGLPPAAESRGMERSP
ncbi:MAG: rRNA pseudouridine synthase [Firmicutes bacterium]|nr:rRNA pseudouridine synthase [Bacillota bacterium]